MPSCPEASPCNYRLAGPGAKCASRHGSLLAASVCLGPVLTSLATWGTELIRGRGRSGLSSSRSPEPVGDVRLPPSWRGLGSHPCSSELTHGWKTGASHHGAEPPPPPRGRCSAFPPTPSPSPWCVHEERCVQGECVHTLVHRQASTSACTAACLAGVRHTWSCHERHPAGCACVFLWCEWSASQVTSVHVRVQPRECAHV